MAYKKRRAAGDDVGRTPGERTPDPVQGGLCEGCERARRLLHFSNEIEVTLNRDEVEQDM
jgi:hypothetical protein